MILTVAYVRTAGRTDVRLDAVDSAGVVRDSVTYPAGAHPRRCGRVWIWTTPLTVRCEGAIIGTLQVWHHEVGR